MKFSKIHILIFIASFALTTLFVWLLLPSNKSKENIYFRQGYDFRKLRFNNRDIDTLKIGEKLEAANIKSTQGKSISTFSDEPLFLLIATDPDCPACNLSNDMMEDVRNTAESIKVAYYPILITSTSPTIDMDKYTKKLGFNDYFYWSSESPIPNSLKQLITPTHILLNPSCQL